MKQKNISIFLLTAFALSTLIGGYSEQTESNAAETSTASTNSFETKGIAGPSQGNMTDGGGIDKSGDTELQTLIYVTGQSMGGMTFLILSTEYPDLFAAELFVSCQWDISTLENLASQKFFYIAAEGDEKASGGQAEVKDMLSRTCTRYSTAVWDATWSSDKFDSAVTSILPEGNSINIATFELGTVLPEGVEIGTNEHMYSFDYAYKIEGVRDWLFEQTR